MTPRSRIRTATLADLDRLVEIHLRAFPDARGVPERVRNFRDNPFGDLSRLFVAEREGIVVAHAFLFSFELGCGGAMLPVAGIASVGVAPEARGRRVATELLAHLHGVARSEGNVASLLFPFREGFYARLGYGKTSPSVHLECDPMAVTALGGSCTVRAAIGEHRARITQLYDAVAARQLGRIGRSVPTWDALFADERRYILVAERDSALVGYVTFSYEQEEAHARVTLRVRDLIARDGDAERSLLSVLGAQRDQVHRIWLEVPYGSHLPQTLLDIDARRYGSKAWEHPIGMVTSGAMVRILDLEKLGVARPFAAEGAIALHVTEEDATYTLASAALSRTVSKAPGRAPHALSTTLAGASSLLLGGISADALVAAGVADGEASVVAKTEALLGRDTFFGCDPF